MRCLPIPNILFLSMWSYNLLSLVQTVVICCIKGSRIDNFCVLCFMSTNNSTYSTAFYPTCLKGPSRRRRFKRAFPMFTKWSSTVELPLRSHRSSKLRRLLRLRWPSSRVKAATTACILKLFWRQSVWPDG